MKILSNISLVSIFVISAFSIITPASAATIGMSKPATTTFTVQSNFDVVDHNIGDGVCDGSLGEQHTICTLRAAIQEANASGVATTIYLPAGSYKLSIPGVDEDAAATGDLDITSNITIIGQGTSASDTIIDGNKLDRVFDVLPTGSLTLTNVTVKNGNSFLHGGGIWSKGTLNINNSVITANTAAFLGGGLAIYGTATINNSTISYNNAIQLSNSYNYGDGIYVDYNNGNLTMSNSTVSYNGLQDSSVGSIAGIWASGSITLTNVTISENGLNSSLIMDVASQSTFTNVTIAKNHTRPNSSQYAVYINVPSAYWKNVIVANNTGSIAQCHTSGGVNYGGEVSNLSSDSSCGFTSGSSLQNTDPVLGLLTNNGGLTQTLALQPGSPAIDHGAANGAPATDQRGVVRPQGNGYDIGAYEYNN